MSEYDYDRHLENAYQDYIEDDRADPSEGRYWDTNLLLTAHKLYEDLDDSDKPFKEADKSRPVSNPSKGDE